MKKPIIVLTLLLISATSYCQVQPPKKNYNIQLTQDDLQIIWTGLQELPGKYADPIKNKIQNQISIQDAPSVPKEKPKTDSVQSKNKKP